MLSRFTFPRNETREVITEKAEPQLSWLQQKNTSDYAVVIIKNNAAA